MKRIDREGEVAYTYSSEPDKPVDITAEQTKLGIDFMVAICKPMLKRTNHILSVATNQPVSGIYIPVMVQSAKIAGVMTDMDSTRDVIAMLEQALARLKEAQKKEDS